MDQLCLYSYWRSSASYRVRIGLNLKGLAYDIMPVHLLRDGGEQHAEAFHAANPQDLVPILQHGQRMLRQSLAIILPPARSAMATCRPWPIAAWFRRSTTRAASAST